MGKHLVVTTEQQDTALRQLGISISQAIQPDGVESQIIIIEHSSSAIYARVTTIDPDGTTLQQYRQYQISTGWRTDKPNSLNADGTE